ncbi:DUF1848 family protein [Candidatus Sumerlaeota bacterium]
MNEQITYTEEEWDGAIASMGRLVDIRNFPDVAADVLMGRSHAFLGRGYQGPTKAIDPKTVGGLVFWTKGPVDLLINHPGLREVLETYNDNHAVVGLELSVTGFGGTFLEPGIATPDESAAALRRVFETGLIDPGSVVLRYDPLMRISAPDGRVLTNEHADTFESIVSLFAPLGVRAIETKSLLLGKTERDKYHHVWQRLEELGISALSSTDIETTFPKLSDVAAAHGMTLFSCCIKSLIPGWSFDSGCLSAKRLTLVGKKSYGEAWDRLSCKSRPSRLGCDCSKYFDLSGVKGHKKCGSQDAACIYCTACAKDFGATIKEMIQAEITAYCDGEREDWYRPLIE